MMKSTSLLLAAVVAVGMMATTASADIKKGQKAYLKTCKNCHGNGTKGAAMHTQAEWEELFANGGANIIKAACWNKSRSTVLMEMDLKINHKIYVTSCLNTAQIQATFLLADKCLTPLLSNEKRFLLQCLNHFFVSILNFKRTLQTLYAHVATSCTVMVQIVHGQE